MKKRKGILFTNVISCLSKSKATKDRCDNRTTEDGGENN